MKPSKLITYFLAIAITVLTGVVFAAATNWTPPTGIPPADNAAAPINISGAGQEKTGGLILGSGLTPMQSALVIPSGNILVGTTVGGPAAPNGSGGNSNVNDIYIRSIGKWASQFTPSCTVSSWAPDPSTQCSGTPFTQASNCGTARTTTGTSVAGSCAAACVVSSWTPTTGTQCSGVSFTQTSNCGTTRVATGSSTTGVCSPPAPINGVCGPAAARQDAAPSSGLCSAGTASIVSSGPPWDWTCYGLNGGTDVSCRAIPFR